MRFFRTVCDLILPRHCISCGAPLRPEPYALHRSWCEACRKSYQKELLVRCEECLCARVDCRCVPKVMKKAGVDAFVKLSAYGEEEKYTVTGRAVLYLKRHRDRAAFDLMAGELSPGVLSALSELQKEEKSAPDAVMTCLPRSDRARRREGFDQAEELARMLSLRVGVRFERLLVRLRDALPQKMLTAEERFENVKGLFGVVGEVRGRTVLLVDDLVTTGAGMSEAAELLRAAGAAHVIAVSLAVA